MAHPKTYKLAFAFEEMMGHITHAQNMKRVLENRPDVSARWLRLPFEPVPGVIGRMPVVRGSWAAQASIAAYKQLKPRLGSLDAILFHTQMCALSALLISRRVPTLISMDCALYDNDAFYESRNTSRAEAAKIRFFSTLFGRTRAMIAWSPWVANSLENRYGVPAEKVHILPPGVDTQFFHPDPQQRANDGVVRLLFVGNGFARKGGDLLWKWAHEYGSEAARRRAGLPPWELHIVSRDEIPPAPNMVVHDNISSNTPELLHIYQSSDLFVMPSHSECFGWVLIEAMACGLPVVSTRTGAIPHITAEGAVGGLVNVGDYDALAARLNELVSDAGARRELGEAARARAESVYDANCNYNRILDLMIACRRGQPIPVAERATP